MLKVIFPHPENARKDGLLAYGGNLDPETLISAYSQGIFPWYDETSPILWWCPDPRCVLWPKFFHISKRSKRKILNSNFYFTIDAAFEAVISHCALPREPNGGTWLLPEMQKAYIKMFSLGLAHSIEIWQNDTLAGGLYGLSPGKVFFAESMFRKVSEASRAALVCLMAVAPKLDITLVDCQVASPHMLAMGAEEISRKRFLEILKDNITYDGFLDGHWKDYRQKRILRSLLKF